MVVPVMCRPDFAARDNTSVGDVDRVAQDTNNLRSQQQGFLNAQYSGRKIGETLRNYQEVRIRHFNVSIDKNLNRETIVP